MDTTQPTPTPDGLDQLQTDLKKDIATAKAHLARFTTSLAKDPVYALEWGGGAFRAAALLSVCESVVDAIEAQKNAGKTATSILAHLRKYATNKVLNGAQHPPHSTSQTSNLMEEEMTRAWATVIYYMS